jgi:uncharacterized membrane protein
MIAATDQSGYGKLFFWLLVLIALVVIGFFVAVWVKRRMQAPDSTPSLGFSLADLRELHRTGKISDQEFERARGKMAASLKRADEKPKKPQ